MIRFRAIEIESITESRRLNIAMTYGPSPQTVVQGRKSVGKSLLVQSMVYVLGLEGAFGAGRQHGLLTRAMTDEVDLATGSRQSVIRSSITAELSNERGDVLTIRRPVVDPTEGDHLVTVTRAPMLTAPRTNAAASETYYVRQRGSAQNERGFHRFLAAFLGWDLPSVATFGGDAVPLYLEVLTPFFVVEQKAGWAGAVPRLPTYLRIREPFERAVDFILGGSDGERTRLLQEVTERERALREHYVRRRAALVAVGSLHGVTVVGLPETAPREPGSSDGIKVALQVLEGDRWVDADAEIVRLAAVVDSPSPSTAEPLRNVGATEERLTQVTAELAQVGARTAALEENAEMVDAQLGDLALRLDHVGEERRRYQELRTLVGLGSPVVAATIARHDCPTCRQSLIGLEVPEGDALDYEASIALLDQQLATLEALRADAERAAERHVASRRALDERTRELRAQIRSLKTDLVSPDGTPSIAALQERLAAEARRSALLSLRESAVIAQSEIRTILADLSVAVGQRRALAPDATTPAVAHRLERWNSLFQLRLREFRFSTLPVDEVRIDISGRPSHAGYDIAFQGSASDGIRLRWAYLVSLLEAMIETGGRHIGFLLMDEPRQQEVDEADFQSLLLRLANLPVGQVVVASSEPQSRLESWLSATPTTIVNASPFLLQPA